MILRLVYSCLMLLVVCLTSSACSDQLDLENAATPLALGMDMDENEQFHFYSSIPVFSKSIKKKSQENFGAADTLRQSRSLQDAHTGGSIQGRNYQVILLGRQFLNYEDWFPMLDVLIRDARNTVTDRIIAVDGPVKDVIYLNPPDQPSVSILLRNMIDTKTKKSETYSTTVQEFHRQFYDKGLTSYIAEVKVINKKIVLKGSALLNQRGKYVLSLGAQDTILLNILQKQADAGYSLSYRIPDVPIKAPFATNMVSFTGGKVKLKIKTAYENDKFKFDIHVKTTIGLSEQLFPLDISHDSKKLEKKLNSLMEQQYDTLIAKLQKNKIDPIGLGVYARAYHYKQFMEVEDHWGEALADADINVKVYLTIGATGPIR
jgi:Ger(x)C family germination protein